MCEFVSTVLWYIKVYQTCTVKSLALLPWGYVCKGCWQRAHELGVAVWFSSTNGWMLEICRLWTCDCFINLFAHQCLKVPLGGRLWSCFRLRVNSFMCWGASNSGTTHARPRGWVGYGWNMALDVREKQLQCRISMRVSTCGSMTWRSKKIDSDTIISSIQ